MACWERFEVAEAVYDFVQSTLAHLKDDTVMTKVYACANHRGEEAYVTTSDNGEAHIRSTHPV